MTSAKRFLHRGHGGKDRWPTGALAAVAVGALLGVAPSVAMGQADEEYLPPPNNPGNDGGPSGNPGGTPPSGDVGTGSPGGGGSGSGGAGGGSDEVVQGAAPAVPSEDPSALPTAPAEGGNGSDNRKRSQGDRERDPAKKLPTLPPLSESVKPTVAFGATTAAASSSDVSTIAILAGIMLAVTLAAVLLRRRLSGSRSP